MEGEVEYCRFSKPTTRSFVFIRPDRVWVILFIKVQNQAFMKLKSTAKMAIGFLAILMSFGILRAQSSSPNQIPFKDDKSKAEWIKSHPAEYAKMTGQVTAKKEARPVNTVVQANPERPANDPNRVENINPVRPANDPNRVENLANRPTELDRANLTEEQKSALHPARKADMLAHPERYQAVKSTSNQ
jgi:hypothetical protein